MKLYFENISKWKWTVIPNIFLFLLKSTNFLPLGYLLAEHILPRTSFHVPSVAPGGPVSPHCTPETCANHGVCRNNPHLQQPCDCDLTSFTGPRCSDGKLSYHLPNIKDTSPLQGIFSSDALFPSYFIFS